MRRVRKKYTGVRRRGEGSFEINYYVRGARRTENVQASSEGEAYAIRLKRLSGVCVEGNSSPVGETPLQAAIEYYLNQTEKILMARTRQRSACIYRHFMEFLAKRYPVVTLASQVTVDIGNKYKDYLLSETGKTPSGINSDITKLRAIFKCFLTFRFVRENPFKQVEKIPKRLARPEKKYLPTDLEIKAILNGVRDDPSYGDITRFLVRTGRRIDETTRYEKADVVCNEQGKPLYIKVRAEITKTKDNGEIPLDEELAGTVGAALAKNPKQKFLFTNRFGRKVTPAAYIEHCLRPICREEGIKGNITPHCFRYYVVNKLLNAGVNPKDAMQITGHIDIGSFLSYLKSTKEGTQRALAATKIDRQ